MNEKPNFFYKIDKNTGRINQLSDESMKAFTPDLPQVRENKTEIEKITPEDREKKLQEDLLKVVTRLSDSSPGNPVAFLNRGPRNGGHNYHSQPPKRL